MPITTLLDIAGRSADIMEKTVVEGVVPENTFLAKMPVKVISGTSYKYPVRTGVPKIRPRSYNAGVEPVKTSRSTKQAECYAYDGAIVVDKALVDGEADGASYIEDEANVIAGAAFFGLTQDVIYGVSKGNLEIPGLINQLGDYMTISNDPAHNTEETRTEGGTSVYALKLKPEDMHLLMGNNRTIAFGATRVQDIPALTDDGKDGTMEAYIKHCTFHAGFVLKNQLAAGRLCNITSANPLTDEGLLKLVEAFDTFNTPTALVMNRLAAGQLRRARTAAMKFGKNDGSTVAGAVTDFDGIPIIVTDAILNDETAANIAAAQAAVDIKLTDKLNKQNLKNNKKLK